MRFLDDRLPGTDLTYSDVFLVPNPSAVASRLDVDLTTRDGTGTTLPLVVANMTAVAGRRMAETVARRGAVAVLPQDIPLDVVAGVVAEVKASHPVLETAVTLSPDSTVIDALHLIPKRAHGALVVIDAERRPVGVVTEGDCRGVDRFTQLHRVMSPDPLTLDLATVEGRQGLRAAFDTLDGARRSTRPCWTPTVGWPGCSPAPGRCARPCTPPPSTRTAGCGCGGRARHQRRRRGQGRRSARGRRDVLVVDTAHGHQQRMLEALRRCGRSSMTPRRRCPWWPGNVVTAGGRARPDRGRRRHRQGGRRAGRHVHHPDDDRRSADRSSPRSWSARPRRAKRADRSGPTAGCGTRATSPWRWPLERAR